MNWIATLLGRGHRGLRPLVAAAGLLAALGGGSVMAADVDNLRLWAAPDHARLVFDLSSPVEADVFTLDSPDRLVIDLVDSRLETDSGALNLEGSAITAVRTGVRDGDDLRVVLDLARRVEPRHFSLSPNDQYGHRLVVDLEYPGESPVEDPIEDMIRAQQQDARPAASTGQAKAAPHPKRDIIIAVDAGHGGEDPGAIGGSGTREKDVVLDIARVLKRIIDDAPGFRGVLIRDGDYYIGLRERTRIAREQKADFFVSIHADAFSSARPKGSSVFALSQRGATSETAKWLADSENRADLIGGVDGNLSLRDKDEVLRGVLLDLTMTATLNDSLAIGGQVLDRLKRVNPLHKPRVEQAGFVVLKSPDIPSLLVETGFISNPQEERRLRDPSHQRGLAQAVFSGIEAHFSRNPPPGSLLAWRRDQGRGQASNEYRIQPGDTLSEIAARHQVSLAMLKQANEINGDAIRVGQVLRIPNS
ncbi:N-acetylmuramoyl-L-alanine amidase [Halomonas sp. YLGW01]|uniref:N-acetylmuramoyl-L-alanine amidase n=1 Tax=Halomonas sp. YLGW01 TaxID=2773308 RepID=UPI001F5B62BF|nr:N-acetylmuramoyl-L-alanine amidase [Halomonas sp. YLGW01]